MKLSERKAERLQYLGVSFGLTSDLLRFWKKIGYVPVYLRQTPNDLTGEHSCIVLKELNLEESSDKSGAASWLYQYFAGNLLKKVTFILIKKKLIIPNN